MRKELYLLLSFVLLVAPRFANAQKNERNKSTINKSSFYIPKGLNIEYKNLYTGIYEIKKDAINKSDHLLLNNSICFTTYEDLGMGYRGYLYVYKPNTHNLVKDRQFKHNYLYSSAAIFIIDRRTNRIFAVDKPEWYDQKGTLITVASMYSINESLYNPLKNIYEKGDQLKNDILLTQFYYRSLVNNGKNGTILPDGWWKMKK
jgi:hypothetical protein